MSIRKPLMILFNPYQHARLCALAYIKRKSLGGTVKELVERECDAYAEQIEDILSVTPDPLNLQALKEKRAKSMKGGSEQ